MIIETNRCRIRAFEEADLDAFMRYRNDEFWMRYQGFKGLTRQEYRSALLGRFSLTGGVQLAVVDKATGSLIGDIYLKQESDSCWIGYTVSPENAGKGFAFESVGGAIAWLRGSGFHWVLAAVIPENKPSVGLLKKLGFDFAGTEEGEDLYALNLRPC